MTNKYLIYEIQKKKLIWFYNRGSGPMSQWLIVHLKEQMLQNSMPIMLHLFQQKIFSQKRFLHFLVFGVVKTLVNGK